MFLSSQMGHSYLWSAATHESKHSINISSWLLVWFSGFNCINLQNYNGRLRWNASSYKGIQTNSIKRCKWSHSLTRIEMQAHRESRMNLFVIGGETRAGNYEIRYKVNMEDVAATVNTPRILIVTAFGY